MVHPAYQELIDPDDCLPIEFEEDTGEQLYQRFKRRSLAPFNGGTFLVLYYQEDYDSILTGARLLPSGHSEVFTEIEPGWKAYVENHRNCLPDHLVHETVFRVI